ADQPVVEGGQPGAALPGVHLQAGEQLEDDRLRVLQLLARRLALTGGGGLLGALEVEGQAVVEHHEDLLRRARGNRVAEVAGAEGSGTHRENSWSEGKVCGAGGRIS